MFRCLLLLGHWTSDRQYFLHKSVNSALTAYTKYLRTSNDTYEQEASSQLDTFSNYLPFYWGDDTND